MTKMNTKRALLMSALALLLCVSMLIGSTYAWFTDTVESGKNVIAAGNLDVELYHTDKAATNEKVTTETKLFDDVTLWEPGAVAYETLTVKNEGSLALKYNLAINLTNENFVVEADGTVTPFGLSSALEVGIISGALDANATREEVVAQVTEWKSLKSFHLFGKLEGGKDADPVTFVIFWNPDKNDNNWNVNNGKSVTDKYMIDGEYALHIDLGVHLKATQQVSESDSFGSDYDKLAPWTGAADTTWYNDTDSEFVLDTAEELAGLAQLVNNGNTFAGKTIKLGANLDLNDVAWTPIGTAENNFGGSFDGNGYTIYNLSVSGIEGVGLIGFAGNAAHIEDVDITNATVTGNHWVGAVLGYGYLSANTLKDCDIKNATVVALPNYVNGAFDNGDKVGAVAGMAINGDIKDNTATDCVVMGYRDVGGIVGLAQAENRTIYVYDNTVNGVTMVYADVLGEYAGNKENQNMDYIVGRANPCYDYSVHYNYDGWNYVEKSSCIEVVATVVAEADELAEALEKGGKVVLVSDVKTDGTIVIPEGVEATLYLNYKTISGNIAKNAGAILENSGKLTIVGGEMTNTANNGGAVIDNKGTLTLDGANVVGAPIDTTGYPAYAVVNSGKLTVEDGTSITSDRGAINMSNGAEVTINGGNIAVTDALGSRVLTSHVIYAYGKNSKLTINGGSFAQNYQAADNTGASVICPAGATINVYGGTFSYAGTVGQSAIFQNYMGYGAPVNVYGGTYSDKSVVKNVASGHKTIQENGLYYVVVEQIGSVASDIKELEEALNSTESGGVVLSNDLEFSAKDTASSNGYGTSGISVNGGILDGNGNTLTVEDANGTWDCAVYTKGGTIKNLTVNGAFRGIFTGGLTSDLYIDNVVVDDVCYTVHADGEGRSAYSLIVTNSTLNGWTSYSDVFASVTFTDCTFGRGTGGYKYAYMRPYNDTVLVNCVFEEGFGYDATCATSVFVNCYYGETLITAENVVELLGSSAASIKFASNAPAGEKVTIVEAATQEALSSAKLENNSVVVLSDGNFIIPAAAQGKTLTIIGSGDTEVAVTKVGSGGENCDYGFDGSNVTLENVTITTNSSTYIGYARCNATYNNCIINGTYTLYGDSVFNNCTFNVSGDIYNIWTWGAPTAEFNNCTFNSDGKALFLYGTANTKLTVNNCVFNDNGGLSDLKAAIEIGNDYGKSYELIVNNTIVNGYEINDKGINTNSTLWANKNSMPQDKLNVVVDGVDVY